MQNFYAGKWVLVTGASSGIGLALAHRLRALGANLLLVARNQDRLEAATEQIRQLKVVTNEVGNPQVCCCDLDISDYDSVQQKLPPLLAQYPLDLLINNAGVVSCARFEDLEPDQFRDNLSINFLGQVWVTQQVLKFMRGRGHGWIVNIASMAGVIGLAGYTAYGASKHALVGFSDSLRNELAGGSVGLTLVLPSDVDTPQLAQENQTKPAANRAISGKVAPLNAGQAAERILVAVAAGKSELVLAPASGRISLFLYRLMPSLARRVIDSAAKPHNKK